MHVSQRLFLPLLVGLFLAPAALADDTPTLSTTGLGQVEAVADTVELYLAVSTRAPGAQQAGSDNAGLSRQVRAALQQAGVAEDAIVTRNYRLQQHWRQEDRERIPDGYEAYHQLVVQGQDPESVGPLIDTALQAGANRVESVQFTVADEGQLRHQALQQAVTRARNEAVVVACAAGGRLGPLLSLTAPASRDRPVYAMRAQAFAESTPITPDTVTVQAEAQAQWVFEPTDDQPEGCGSP